MRRLLFIAVIVTLTSGCISSRQPADIQSSLLRSAQEGDPDFPDGQTMVLTHFSHVGQIVSSRGELVYVADRRAALTGMLAPRGQNFITFFDQQFRYLGKIRYTASRPLWCDGSRLYLFGELDGLATGLSGNVIDIADGFSSLRVYSARAYGSSGGIGD